MDRASDPAPDWPHPGVPDWDAIAGARLRRRTRGRVARLVWTTVLAAGIVAALALLAAEREARVHAETLALAFVPEVEAAAPVPAPELVEAGRFADATASFAIVGTGPASGVLFLEAVRLAALADGLAVTRAAAAASVETPLGPAEVAAATLEARDGRRRACTAFRHGGSLGGALVGLVCPGKPACAPSDLPEPARAVAASLVPACAGSRELDRNPDPSRASPPQTGRDRTDRWTKTPRNGVEAPKS